MELRGKVCSGLERGAYFIGIYADYIKTHTGMVPYPGTLNVKLDEDVKIKFTKKMPRFRWKGVVYGWVGLREAKLDGEDVYIIFPEKTVHEKGVIEIISPKYLRDALKLRDGSEVIVKVS